MHEFDFNETSIKVIMQEATPEELVWFEQQLLEVSNAELHKKNRKLWEIVPDTEFQFDANMAWDKVLPQLNKKPGLKLTWKKTYSIAASAIILLGLGIGFWVFRNNNHQFNQIIASKPLQHEKLPDGSEIMLSKGANLNYAEDFNKNRQLHLKGTAFFKVEKDKEHPFVINTEVGKITVIGTQFEVDAYANRNTVVVKEGKVKVEDEKGNYLFLTAGMSAEWSKQQAPKIMHDKQLSIDLSGVKKFDHEATVTEVINFLEQQYHVKIICIGNTQQTLKYDIRFQEMTLEQLLENYVSNFEGSIEKINEKEFKIILP